MVSPPRALLSVSDKEGLVDFARGLRDLGFELIGTDGTAKILKDAGLPVTTVADFTGLREGLGGRVKTLHPRIFAGILAPTGDEKDLKDLGAVAIDLVIVNLSPFAATVAKPNVTVDAAVEHMDIGVVSLSRSATTNDPRAAAPATAERLQGRELSYNNLIDLDAALRVSTEFERPAAVVIKHTNPSGVAIGTTLAQAYESAHAADPISAYGGVVGVNRTIDLPTAKAMKGDVLDAVIAPGYEPQALEILKGNTKGA